MTLQEKIQKKAEDKEGIENNEVKMFKEVEKINYTKRIEDKTMTREEEIKYASKDYVNYLLDKQEYHNENYTEDDIRQAFEKGAKWADEYPKSPWISVKEDLTCNNYELIDGSSTVEVFAACKNGYFSSTYMIKGLKKWGWYDFKPDYWMIPPKLPKE